MTIAFTVPGRPVAKHRALRFAGGRAYRTAESRAYEAEVALRARQAMAGRSPLAGDVEVWMSCSLPDRRWMPDADGIAKGPLDGMRGIVYRDDRQVVRLVVDREIARAVAPYLWIEVKPVERGNGVA